MSHDNSIVSFSRSYFWSCITLNEDCPFFVNIDPKLYYFGYGLIVLYGAFVLMILGDLSFLWSVDKLQDQIDYYINLMRRKVRHVQMDQRRLMTTQERTEKQLKRSQESKRMVQLLRGALSINNARFNVLTTNQTMERPCNESADSDLHSEIDF